MSARIRKMVGADPWCLWICAMGGGWVGGSLLGWTLRPLAYHNWYLMAVLCVVEIVRPLPGRSRWWGVKNIATFGIFAGILCSSTVYVMLSSLLCLILIQRGMWALAHARARKEDTVACPVGTLMR